MKTFIKIIILGIIFFTLSCNRYDVKIPSVDIQKVNGINIAIKDYYVSGMHYKIFHSDRSGLFVVNVTKDSLDVSLYSTGYLILDIAKLK